MKYSPRKVKRIIENWETRYSYLTGGLLFSSENQTELKIRSDFIENKREEFLVEHIDIANTFLKLTPAQQKCIFFRCLGYSIAEIASKVGYDWPSNVSDSLFWAYRKIAKLLNEK